jgi:DUF1016 N-terminal domain/YhcG PDDEXK nuclease domain
MNTATNTPIRLTTPPEGYTDWLGDLKARIHAAQQRATLSVNRELVLLYWQIGRDILTRQAQQGWGAKVIERLAHDLRAAFPVQVKNEHNNPTIGLLLCKNKMVAEYALGDKTQSMGVAKYKQLASLPAQLQTSLPTIEQMSRELMGSNTP